MSTSTRYCTVIRNSYFVGLEERDGTDSEAVAGASWASPRSTSRLLPAFRAGGQRRAAGHRQPSLDKAQAAARAAGIPVAHGSYEALLDDPTIDAVYIPLPNTLHAEWTRKAADRGKHVLCEKPLTPTAAEAAELVAYCRAKSVKLMDGFMWPHHPRTARLRQLLDSGEHRRGPQRHRGIHLSA